MNYAREIVDRVPMETAARYYGMDVNRAGFCRCPFHAEKTASMKIYPGDRGWHCFGCGEGGSVIDFVKKFYGLSYTATVAKINSDFSLGLPIDKTMDRRERLEAGREAFLRRKAIKEQHDRRNSLIQAADCATARYAELDLLRIKHAPKPGDIEPDPLYIEAMKALPEASYRIDVAEMEMYAHEHRDR